MSEFDTSKRAKWFAISSLVAGGLLIGHGTSRAPIDDSRSATQVAVATNQPESDSSVPWNVEGIIGGIIMMSGVIAAVPRRRAVSEQETVSVSMTSEVRSPIVSPVLRIIPNEAA